MNWEFSFTPTESEQLLALRCVQGKLLRSARAHWRTRAWGTTAALLGGMAGFATMMYGDGAGRAAGTFFLYGMIGALLLQALYAFTLGSVIRKTAIAADPALYTGPRTISFDEDDVLLRWENGEMRFPWKAMSGLEQQGDVLVLLFGAHYLILPDRLFATADQRQDWLSTIADRYIAPEPPVRSSLPARLRHGLTNAMATLIAHLSAGIRMALLRPVRANEIRATPLATVSLLLLWCCLHVAADAIVTGEAGHFSLEGLPGLLFIPALLGIAAILATALGRCPERLLALFAALLALAIPMAALTLTEQVLALDWTDAEQDSPWRFTRLAPIWLALASAPPIARWLNFDRRRRLGWLLSLTALVILPLNAIQPYDALWVAASGKENDKDTKYDALIQEDTFYRQPQLLAEALDRLGPQQPEATDLYFIGLGGDAEQAVFMREVQSVSDLMDQWFGTGDHSITLVNNYRAARDYPVASATALEQSIQRVAERMDRNNDILFLFLTSHGSRDHELILDFWPLKFKPLNPAILRDMLDQAGIRWRVIVVSACYSGGYIEPLKDDHSIVITAAAADKTSFGCADENDWTYFGRAFFEDALAEADGDLDQAFASARAIIERREAEEGIDDASDPQIASGNEMRQKWRTFLNESQAANTAEP